MYLRKRLSLLFVVLLAAAVFCFQNCGSGGGGGGVEGATAGSGSESWKIVLSGAGGNAQCSSGVFSENYTFNLVTSGMLSATLAARGSATINGTGTISGDEVVTTQSSIPTICVLEPTTVLNVPATLDARTTSVNGAPYLQMFVRGVAGATLVGCKALITSLATRADVPADELTLTGSGFNTPGVITGSWQTVGGGGPGNGNNAQGTFVMTLVNFTPAIGDPPPSPTPNPIGTPIVNHRLSITNVTTAVADGSVVSSPGGILCQSCVSTYGAFTHNTTVSLSASLNSNAAALEWGGDCVGAGAALSTQLLMDSDRDCTIKFKNNFITPLPSSNTALLLRVSKTGTGNGTVTANPGSINCGTTCSNVYTYGNGDTSVALTALPAVGSSFVKWMGDCAGATLTTAVVMNSNKTCTAIFTSP